MRVKILFALLGVLFYNSSFATLEQCYKDGADEEYEKYLIHVSLIKRKTHEQQDLSQKLMSNLMKMIS